MADKKINDLTNAAVPVDSMQFETDRGGTIANKIAWSVLKKHSQFSELDYDDADHTGFQRGTLVLSAPPTPNDDSTKGYDVGLLALDNTANDLYYLVDNTAAAAVWIKILNGSDIVQKEHPALVHGEYFGRVPLSAIVSDKEYSWGESDNGLAIPKKAIDFLEKFKILVNTKGYRPVML